MSNGSQFDDFEAAELYCPTCKASRPVRSRLLLVLPSGNKYEYSCVDCGTTVGSKTDNDTSSFGITEPPPQARR